MTSSDDRQLVEQSRQGDLRAFDELVEKYKASVYRFVLHNVWKEDDAEDLAQESFVRAYQGLERFRGGASFRTWLFRIALNLCIDHRRKVRSSKSIEFQAQDSAEALRDIADSSNPHEALRQQELAEQVQRAMRRLPQRLPR